MAMLMMALAAGTAVYSHEQQSQAAEDQGEALNEAEKARQSDMERAMQQQAEAATEEMNAAHRASLNDMATLEAIAGEFGGGNTVSRARAVTALQHNENLATVTANGRRSVAEIGYASRASQFNTRNQLSSIQTPSKVGLALQIANAGAQAYGSYETNQRLDKLASKGATIK